MTSGHSSNSGDASKLRLAYNLAAHQPGGLDGFATGRRAVGDL